MEGQVVTAIILLDHSVIKFDYHKRAHIRGSSVEGYVAGTFRTFSLDQIGEMQLGSEDRGRTMTKVVVGSLLIVAAVVGMYFMGILGWDE